MKGMLVAAGAQAKMAVPAAAPVRRSVLVTARAPVSKATVFKAARKASVKVFAAAEGATQKISLEAIKPGEEFEGKVTKVEQFGAFVNFGASKDGLVHISQLSDKYVKNVASVVKVDDVIRVRVMSVDASSGRIALSMKGFSGAEEAEDVVVDDAADEEEEEGEYAEEDDEPEFLEPSAEGRELVTVDEEPDIAFELDEEDPELSVESVAAFEALEADQIEIEVDTADMPVPIGELISGKVTRVEEYGAFIEFQYNGKTLTGLLERDEAKVPSATLSPEQLKDYVEDGEEVPQYVDEDIESNMANFYKPGDAASAFVLEYNEDGKLALTQYEDWELDEAAQALALLEELDEAPETVDDETDPLAMDPLDLIEGGDRAGDAFNAEDAVDGNTLMRQEFAAGVSSARLMTDGLMVFPSRQDRVNPSSVSRIRVKDTDFDGDEIELDDFWQETIRVPKSALKRLGLKMQYNEAGEPEIVEREGAEAKDFDPKFAFKSSREARVANFVKDLLEADEDEAELPARAMRRPVVLAAAVQNISAAVVKQLRDKTGAGMMDCKKALAENDGDFDKSIEWLRKKGLAGADKKAGRVAAEGAIATYIHPGARLGVLLEVNCETDFVAASDKFQGLIGELGMIIASCPDVICVSPEDVPAEVLAKERDVEMGKEDIKSKPEAVRAKIVEGRIQKIKDNMALVNQDSLRDPNKKVSEVIKETIAAIGENIQVRRFVRYTLGEGLEKRSNDFAAEVAQQTQAKAPAPKKEEPKVEAPKEVKPVVAVAASVVKELRDKTGAGMMDCKKALAENGGDMEASVEWLRKKGLASADKKAGRLAAEGAIVSYIHPGSRLGVLLEVNCETDFVAASEGFNKLVSGIAMQIAASPTVQYVAVEDIPPEVYAREKEIEMGREDLKSKPEAVRAKIAEGRVAKLGQEMALLPQPYLMDSSKTVELAIKEAVATIGEKISVRRFVKFQLGEGIEKKVSNLAADVAAATGGKA